MWVHCPRASNGLLHRRSNLVGYVRWDAQSDQFPPCQTIIPTAFRSQSELPVIRPEPIRFQASCARLFFVGKGWTSVCAILLASRLTGGWFMANPKASPNLETLPTSPPLVQTLPSDAVLAALKMILLGAPLNEVLTT